MLGPAESPGPCWLTKQPKDQCQDPLGCQVSPADLSSQSVLQATWYPGAFSGGREDHAVDSISHGPGKGKLEKAKVILLHRRSHSGRRVYRLVGECDSRSDPNC